MTIGRNPPAKPWDDFMLESVRTIDARLAVREDPEREGLQTLLRWQAVALLDWIEAHVTPGDRVCRWATSADVARMMNRDLGDRLQLAGGVTNLQAKAALALAGYEPATPNTQFSYYKFELAARRGKR